MSVATPETIVRPFGNPALGPTDPGGMVLPIPVPSQIGIENGAASFTDGFVPLNMTDPALGGILPAGQDFNGLLYMITSYCAWLQGGGGFTYNADFVTQNTGYGVGAILRSAADPSKFFMNTVANNANDPDVDQTGWIGYSPIASPTGVQTAAPGAGTFTVALNPGVGFLDITPSAAATLTNITGATDGQILTVTNLSGAFGLTVQANANIRMAGDLGLLENNTTTLRYSAALGLWTNLNG
jgi:hypothetical protein